MKLGSASSCLKLGWASIRPCLATLDPMPDLNSATLKMTPPPRPSFLSSIDIASERHPLSADRKNNGGGGKVHQKMVKQPMPENGNYNNTVSTQWHNSRTHDFGKKNGRTKIRSHLNISSNWWSALMNHEVSDPTETRARANTLNNKKSKLTMTKHKINGNAIHVS